MNDQTVHRGYSRCRVLWFAQNTTFDVGQVQGIRDDLSEFASQPQGRWLAGGQTLSNRRDDSSDIIACSWMKDTAQPAGIFNLQLVPSNDWLNLITPGDIMVLFMSKDMKTESLVTVGIVDRVAESRHVDTQGATVATVTVSGRDLGKILQETSTVFDPSFAQKEQAFFTEAFQARLGTQYAFSPVEAVLTMLDIVYNAEPTNAQYVKLQWRFPGSESVPVMALLDTKSYVQAPMFGYTPQHQPQFVQSGNVWTLCKAYTNDMVNEFFIDIREVPGTGTDDDGSLTTSDITQHLSATAAGFVNPVDAAAQVALRDSVAANFKAMGQSGATDAVATGEQQSNTETAPRNTLALIFRQNPYDSNAFLQLKSHELDETEIFDSQFGITSHEVFNFFRVRFANLWQALQEVITGIVVNPESIARFGLRRFDGETRYWFADSNSAQAAGAGTGIPGDFTVVFAYYVNLLAVWHAFNERMMAGNITTRLRPDIRVGERLRVNRTRQDGAPETIEFYVQAKTDTFINEPGGSTSQLTVVRGIRRGVAAPESTLYWTSDGASLPIKNPYEVFIDEDFQQMAQATAGVTPKVP
jgi:hypothetical protein